MEPQISQKVSNFSPLHWLYSHESFFFSRAGKFANSVPPEQLNIINHCTKSSSLGNATAGAETSDILEDPLLRSIVIGSGAGIALLLCFIAIVCTGSCYLNHRHETIQKNYKVKAEISCACKTELSGMFREYTSYLY